MTIPCSGMTRAVPELVALRYWDERNARFLAGCGVGRLRSLGATSPRGSGREHQGDSQMSRDLHPTGSNVYGYAVA